MIDKAVPYLIDLQVQSPPEGKLTILEALPKTGFVFKRLYILSDIAAGIRRGYHAHKNLYQALIPLGGEFKAMLKGKGKTHDFTLHPALNKALIIPPGFWRELYDFSPQAICLVAASDEYDEDDYIRDYNDFLVWEKSHG